jgi:polysaccharide biosynthesis transport protein
MQDVSPRSFPPLPDASYRQYETSLANEEVHLRDYLSVLSKRRRLVISVFLLVLLAGLVAFFPKNTLYTASATLKIEPQNPLGTVGEAVNVQYNNSGGYDYYKTQFELLKSRRLAKKVITDLNLGANPAFLQKRRTVVLKRLTAGIAALSKSVVSPVLAFVSPPAPSPSPTPTTIQLNRTEEEENRIQGLIGQYLSMLNVSPIRDTRLVQVEFTTLDPKLSQELANAHAAAFIRTNIETRFELTAEARDFLEKKLIDVRDKLERSEKALDDFRRQYGVVSLEGSDNVVANRMLDLNRRLVEARDKRIEVESLYRAVQDKNSQNLSKIIDNERIQQLKGQLNSLEIQNTRLALMYRPEHPSMQEQIKQLNETRRQLEGEIATIRRGIEADYRVAYSREKALENETEREQQEALKLKRIGIAYTILDQETKSQRVLYERLLQRLNETNISNTTAVSNIDVAEEAVPGDRLPSSAERKLLAVALLGLLLGGGLAFSAEYFNSVVETPETVWRSVGVPTLGVVPHLRYLRQNAIVGRLIPGSSSNGNDHGDKSLTVTAAGRPVSEELIIFHQPMSIFPESYRAVRTSLLYSQEAPPPPVLLVTSAHPNEGKTLTTLNLAITLAQNDYNVLIVDADLRRGNCHARLQMENLDGLANVLSDRQDLQACIRPTPVRKLSLLSRGDMPANPTDLLGSPRMKKIMAELREQFDFVLIDSPPALVVSDATVLATICDGVLLVVNGQSTTLQMVQLLHARLNTVRAPVVGVILNAVDMRNPKYAYYRSYYKSYPTNVPGAGNVPSPGETQGA